MQILSVTQAPTVVGYQNIENVGGNKYSWMINTLKQIDKTMEKQTVSNFAFPKDTQNEGSDSMELSVYNSSGSRVGRYYFLDDWQALLEDIAEENGGGWYDADEKEFGSGDWVLADDAEIPFGTGVVFFNGEDARTATMSGEVYGDSYPVEVVPGNKYTWTGNYTAKRLYLKDFVLPGDTQNDGSDSIELSIYNESGTRIARYYFLDDWQALLEDIAEEGGAGWYDADEREFGSGDWVCVNETAYVEPGQLTLIFCGEDLTRDLTLPSALAK